MDVERRLSQSCNYYQYSSALERRLSIPWHVVGVLLISDGRGLAWSAHRSPPKEAQLSLLQRVGTSEQQILVTQSNIANTYLSLGRLEDCLRMRRDVYSGLMKLHGVENEQTLTVANNYAESLIQLKRFQEAKRVLRKVIPVAQRLLGTVHACTVSLREDLALATLQDGNSTLGEKREALRTLEDTLRVMRRVLGTQHPETQRVQRSLYRYREELSESESA